ncbi:serine hydrolase domain-containing protein [Clostridium rectalis]|uniref:serine hydrolase domain-containing protein n=1 Tax=Clostridium rectalis TaxID=2040295 RepID=UPI0019D0F0C6|nr:serine hydrolase domain-containing protein [Clostridium rectalis]
MLNVGIDNKVFPGAAVLIGSKFGVVDKFVCGYSQIYPKRQKMMINTLFDLASLTKVVATTPLIMKLIEMGEISLYDNVRFYLPQFQKHNELKIINLLTHTTGFMPFIPLYKVCKTSNDILHVIADSKLQCDIGQKVIYSDSNFIILRYITEKVLQDRFDKSCYRYIFKPLGMNDTSFNPKNNKNIASTEFDNESKSYLKGIVHDENARYLNGISGHAGLFSNIQDLCKYCDSLLYFKDNDNKYGKYLFSENTIECMINNYTKTLGESRGLGFCVKAHGENSSGGELISEGAFGHTGFTGTSIWIDRRLGVYIILLTNRVHFSRENNKIIRFRRVFHNSVIAELNKI